MKRKEIYNIIDICREKITRLEYELGLEMDAFERTRKRIELMTARDDLYMSIELLKENEFSAKFKRGCKKAWELFLSFLR